MTIGEAVAIRVDELCAERQITINRLGTISGITQSTLSNINNRKSKNPTISTIKKICDGFGISIVEFFDTNLFCELDQELK